MAIISCPECGKQVSDRAVSCPNCGCPISAVPAPVAAPVQQNPAEELEKLLVLARRAREASDSRNAKRYYDQILDKDPGNWEAIFYSVYFEAAECKIMYISSAANSVANCIHSTFSAIAELPDSTEQAKAIVQVIASATVIAAAFASSAKNHYSEFSTVNGAYSECSGRIAATDNIYGAIETGLKRVFPEKKELLVSFQKNYVAFMENNRRWYNEAYYVNTMGRLDREIAGVCPEHGKRRELEGKISAIDRQINGLVTVRTAPAGCIGWFFLIVGIIMLVLGLTLSSLSGESWGILVAIPELVIAYFCLRKKPSQAEVDENLRKKSQLMAERAELQRQLDALR